MDPAAPLHLDRLSAGDLSNLRVEDHGLPMHVAGLLLLDGAPLHDAAGTFRFGDLLDEIGRRLANAPRLRQRLLVPPLGLGRPLWVDDARFDLTNHVRASVVAPPGDERTLLAAVADHNRAPLDRSRPLWDLSFLTGLADGRVGMLLRLHHTVADGIASVALLGALFDTLPDVRWPDPPPWVPRPAPTREELRVDRRLRRRESLTGALPAVTHPGRWLPRARSRAAESRRFFGEGLAPATSLNGPIGTGRLLFVVRADLERARTAAHAHGGTINDVLLAGVGGGARALLAHRGELTGDLELRVSVPVSRRADGDETEPGNRVGVMVVPVPVGEADDVRRLERIALETGARKSDDRAVMGWDVASPLMQRAVVRVMRRQRFINMLVSNVPGPPMPLYFAGAEVLEAFQVSVLQGNVTLVVGALSYAGRLGLDVVADADACPDAQVFVDGLATTFEALGAAQADA